MTTTKQTSTPWDTLESANSNLIHIETPLENPAGGGISIATMTGNREIAKANAAFIVRACNAHDDLVAALESCVAAITYDTPEEAENGTNSLPGDVILKIQSALAKARGES